MGNHSTIFPQNSQMLTKKESVEGYDHVRSNSAFKEKIEEKQAHAMNKEDKK